MARVLKWWVEEPKISPNTRFWIEVPYDYIYNIYGFYDKIYLMALYKSNAPIGGSYALNDVFYSVHKPILAYWDFSANGIDPQTATLVNQAGSSFNGYVHLHNRSFPTPWQGGIETYRKVAIPNIAPRRCYLSPLGYTFPLANNEYIEITEGLSTLTPADNIYSIALFFDLSRMASTEEGIPKPITNKVLFEVYLTILNSNNDTQYNLAVQIFLHYLDVKIGIEGIQDTTAQMDISIRTVDDNNNAIIRDTLYYLRYVWNKPPSIWGITMPLVLRISRTNVTLSTSRESLSWTVPDNHRIIRINRITIGAHKNPDNTYTDFSEPALACAILAKDDLVNTVERTGWLEYDLGFSYDVHLYFNPNDSENHGTLTIRYPTGKLHLVPLNTNLSQGLPTNIEPFSYCMPIYIRNEDKAYYPSNYDYVFPITLNTQAAHNAGLLRADLRDLVFIAFRQGEISIPPPPTQPPPPPEIPSTAIPSAGEAIVFFMNADTESYIGGLVYDTVNQVIRDTATNFPIPYSNQEQKILGIEPLPPYGFDNFVRWQVDYKTSQGETKSAFGTILPISLYGLDIGEDSGLRVTFYFKKGEIHTYPSTNIQDFNKYYSSSYIIVPSTAPLLVSGDYTIRYDVGVDVVQQEGDFNIRYSVGIDYTPVTNYLYQNILTGEESWSLVYASPTSNGAHPIYDYLKDYRLRHFHVAGNNAYLLLISDKPPVRVKLVIVNLTTGDITERAAVDLGSDWDDDEKAYYPSFGSVAVGHDGIVYANTHGAVYFPFSETHTEPLLLSFLSSNYPIDKKKWSNVSVLVVPEGFLFLPHAILWDLDVFWDFPTNIDVTEGDRVIPVYFEGVAGVIVRSKEQTTGGGNIKAFYLWGGMQNGLVRAQYGAATGLESVAPLLGGSFLDDKWYAFNAKAHPDESTIVEYSLERNNQMDYNKIVVSRIMKALPLPFPSPVARARWKPPAWGEIWGFNTTSNASYLYFTRVWDRIYRLDVNSWDVRVAHVIPYLDFGGNLIPRFMGGEEAWLMFSYNLSDGRVYCAHLRSGGRLQIWRQSQSIIPPSAPIIIFPPSDIQVPRQFDVRFAPRAYNYPQEFSVTIIAQTSNGYRVFQYYSTLHRNLFEVSTDGGTNFSPMTGPVTVNSSNEDDVVVKFNVPYPLPPSSTITVTVRAIAVIN